MPNTVFNWGVLAPGRIAHQFAQALPAVANARLYAVASHNPQRGAAFAQTYGAERVYSDYAALAADPMVDAVYIANPHALHPDAVRLCLDAGKPVLCEKPLTVSSAQAQALFERAAVRGVFLMEALWTRFLPAWQQVRTWLDAGRIGELRLIASTFGATIPLAPEDRWLNPKLAGGVLLDMGIYCVAMSQFVMQRPPQRIVADSQIGATGVDERSSVILNYGDAASQFTCSFHSALENRFTIYGSHGTICVAPNFWAATRACLRPTDSAEEVFDAPFRANGFEYQIEAAMHSIRAGLRQNPVIPWRDTVENLSITDAVRAQVGVRYPASVAGD